MNSEDYSEMWQKIPADEWLVENAVKLSERDLKTAQNMLDDKEYDWCYSVSYNAMLQSGRALMFAKGFRPVGEFKHVSVIEFVKRNFKSAFTDQVIFMFNKIRKKRHTAVYEQINLISEEEAKTALSIAKEFHEDVKKILASSQ